jgi:OFA family oxalate/formate antiporter-like MFS transporter
VTIARDEFRSGWRALVASSLGIACGISPIPFFTIGQITPALQSEFGWSRAEIMTAVTVVGVTNALTTPAYGVAMDRWGVRRVALASLVGFAACWMLVARNPGSLPLFYATWFAMSLLGSGSQPISWTRVVNAWFQRSRGLALGLALTGTGLAGFALNACLPGLVYGVGWRGAVLATACLPLALALPVAMAWFREPADGHARARSSVDAAAGLTARAAMRTPRFWAMVAIFSSFALAYGGLSANFVPRLRDAGWSAADAGLTVGMLGVSTVIGRVLAGYLFDRFWAPLVAAPLLLGPVATCLLLTGGTVTPTAGVVAATLLGLAAGLEADLIAYLSARYFGLRSYGTLYGILYGGFGLGAALSPPLYGWVHDVSGRYDPALWAAAAVFIGGALSLLLLGRYPEEVALTRGQPRGVAAHKAG